ncbi:prenyltransferase/squalene oxidase repeat-containing protein [Limnoglobus roseus]|uniref:Prenyltransferase n=1 Tax=Limnoglobus roseus TaxID=2598579 RepID=A0A5C1A9F0_9BACT|nr:prenyltransferase/squalene oxidase repeat-containing protein [Limnoglobus roseus]QEL15350.1 prenyltransferase [Limnoglobus roseus]
MRLLLTLGLVFALAAPASAAPPRELMDEAIDRGLIHLRNQQGTDGSWPGGGFGMMGFGGAGDPAISSLAVMAFLSAGHVPGEGKHGAAVEKGIKYVMGQQQRDGLFAAGGGGNAEMYCHGICTLMLAEAAGMTDGKLADELRKRLEAAVTCVLAGQRNVNSPDNGGWRYHLKGFDADLSVTGWQLMALRGARNLGCDVPADRIKRAVDYIKRCQDPFSGGFRYTVSAPVTIPCTGTAILGMELCGKEYHRAPELLRAGKLILSSNLNPAQQHFFYGIYYTSQGMFQLGGNEWKAYRPKLHDLLLRQNGPRADGSWQSGGGHDDRQQGSSYCTAMAILALTVEYRYLPIYQRFEEPIEKDAIDP